MYVPGLLLFFMCQIAVDIILPSTNSTFCKHQDVDSDNVMSTLTRRLLGRKRLCQGQLFVTSQFLMVKDVSLARGKPNIKCIRVPSRHWMQKPDSECAENHIINASEVQVGFLGWTGNILSVRSHSTWQLADCRLFQRSMLASAWILLAEPTAQVGLWKSLAPSEGAAKMTRLLGGSSGFMMCANNWVHYSPMVVFICLHITLLYYHHYANVHECASTDKLILHRTPEGLETDLLPKKKKNGETRGYSEVSRQGRMFLLC